MIIEQFFRPINKVKREEIKKPDHGKATKPEKMGKLGHPKVQEWLRKNARKGK